MPCSGKVVTPKVEQKAKGFGATLSLTVLLIVSGNDFVILLMDHLPKVVKQGAIDEVFRTWVSDGYTLGACLGQVPTGIGRISRQARFIR